MNLLSSQVRLLFGRCFGEVNILPASTCLPYLFHVSSKTIAVFQNRFCRCQNPDALPHRRINVVVNSSSTPMGDTEWHVLVWDSVFKHSIFTTCQCFSTLHTMTTWQEKSSVRSKEKCRYFTFHQCQGLWSSVYLYLNLFWLLGCLLQTSVCTHWGRGDSSPPVTFLFGGWLLCAVKWFGKSRVSHSDFCRNSGIIDLKAILPF